MKTGFVKTLLTLAVPVLTTISLLSPPAFAQAPQTVGVRGAITSVSEDSIKVHTNRGEDLSIRINDDTQVRAVTLAKVTDIKPGSYIGSAATPLPNGSLKALEVHVFP